MSAFVDYAWAARRRKSPIGRWYSISAVCRNCGTSVTVRLAFGQPKWETHIPDRGPECPRCGCRKLTPGSIVGVES